MSAISVPKVVLRTGASLLLLWALSFSLSYVPLGAASLPVALAIALVKAVLVVLFFMELLHESVSMKFAIAAALGLLAVLIGLMVADVATREPAPLTPPGSQASSTAGMSRTGMSKP
jgi:cytochrome c oxidase subunit 4